MTSYEIPNITFGGLATGLDTNSIIASLVAVERLPITLLENQKSSYQEKIDYFNTFKSKLDDLQSAAEDLKSESDFNLFTTTLSTEGILTASAGTNATKGTYAIEVFDLATFEQEASGNFADKNASFGNGTISINVGGTVTDVTIQAGQDSLEDIVAAINNSDAAVNASIVNDGSGTPYRLVITGEDTGEDNWVTVDASGLSGGTETLGAFSEIQAASDSHFEVNGIAMQRSTNEVTDAAAGLNLTLLSTTDVGEPITVTVSHDTEEVKSEIENFINKYNAVMNFINKQSAYDTSAEKGGVLIGESLLHRIQNSLQSIFIPSKWDNDPEAPEIQILAQIGISFENDATFTIDDEELTTAIEENFDDVVRLFTDSEIGFALGTESYLEDYTKLEGIIDGKNDGFETIIRNLETQVSRAEDRLDAFEAGLLKKFSALESLMSGLQSQQAILYSQSFGYYRGGS